MAFSPPTQTPNQDTTTADATGANPDPGSPWLLPNDATDWTFALVTAAILARLINFCCWLKVTAVSLVTANTWTALQTFSAGAAGTSASFTTLASSGNTTVGGTLGAVAVNTTGTVTAGGELYAAKGSGTGLAVVADATVGGNVTAIGSVAAASLSSAGAVAAAGAVSGATLASASTVAAGTDITAAGELVSTKGSGTGLSVAADASVAGKVTAANLVAPKSYLGMAALTAPTSSGAIDRANGEVALVPAVGSSVIYDLSTASVGDGVTFLVTSCLQGPLGGSGILVTARSNGSVIAGQTYTWNASTYSGWVLFRFNVGAGNVWQVMAAGTF